MKSFKNHISVIFPLVVLLFSIEFTIMSDKIVKDYENFINNNYSIIIVSKNEINPEILRSKIRTFKELVLLDTNPTLNKLKNDVSSVNLKTLSAALPKFYSLKLRSLPNENSMRLIEQKILSIDGVTKVQTFTKTQGKIYKILLLCKLIFISFSVLIAVIGITLIFKQMRIWLYEHKRRVQIMSLFGAPYWTKSAILYKIAIVDSIISTILVTLCYLILPNLKATTEVFESIELTLPMFDLMDFYILFAASIIASILAVTFVMIKTRQAK